MEKSLVVDLSIGLMKAVVPLAERAARLPAGPSNPHCHGGMSFTTLRDASALPPGRAARRFFVEQRFEQLAEAANLLRATGDRRAIRAADQLVALSKRAARGLSVTKPNTPIAGAAGAAATGLAGAARPAAKTVAPSLAAVAAVNSPSTIVDGVETAKGQKLDLLFETKRCIHAHFCVTGASERFSRKCAGALAAHPDAMEVERVVEVAHACRNSGAMHTLPTKRRRARRNRATGQSRQHP